MAILQPDLVIEAGRLFCARGGIDAPGRVAIRGDRIAAVAPAAPSASSAASPVSDSADSASPRVLQFPAAIVLPGLIDLHAHPDNRPAEAGGSKFGLDPDTRLLARGTTTVLSQGDAGADNWDTFRSQVIERCRTRILMALNLSRVGETTSAGCFSREDWVDAARCIRTLATGDPALWGIACNVSEHACETLDPRPFLRRGIDAADTAGVPLLFGVHHPRQWAWDEQLAQLRPGDVMTYLYRDEHWSILQEHGDSSPEGTAGIRPAILEARARGILFDVGHGCGSFSFPVASAAIAAGFPPDTISTDGQQRHVGHEPVHDLPRVMSKLLAAGMPEHEVFAAVTSRPAEILRMAGEIGELSPGACADLTILQWNPAAEPLADVRGAVLPGHCLEAVCVVRNGQVVATDGRLLD